MSKNTAIRIVILLLATLIINKSVLAQAAPGERHRILIIMNGSQKMLDTWSANENNYQVSSRIISSLIDSLYQINDEVEFGLRVYGHQQSFRERDCYDSKREVMFSRDTRAQMKLRLTDIKPKGAAPLSFAISEANSYDISTADQYIYSVIFVTDGSVDCSADACAKMKELRKKLKFTPYVLQVNTNEQFRNDYNCLGEFLTIKNEENIKYAIGHIVQAYRKILPPKRPETASTRKQQSKPAFEPLGTTKPKTNPTPPVTAKKDTASYDTLKTGRVATAPPVQAVLISKNSRIKAEPENKNGYAILMNISRIPHIAIYQDGAPDSSPTKDIFPVGLDVQKVELKPGYYKLVYMLYGYQLGLNFTVEQGKETEVWLAR
ncbi:vWA domain-containing protein [Polluticoccus soli]|uniref:vWA domain-containing protein n=1 Tax=Polluticoccus soli TaxID=3034150 RepID=UPI0023E123AC|nr:vWA domain-containing protein [Flavipsychrobacter sp. JY13-12]